MNRGILDGRYIVKSADYERGAILHDGMCNSRVSFPTHKGQEIDIYNRHRLIVELSAYEVSSDSAPSSLKLEISDNNKRESIEARAFSVTKYQLQSLSIKPEDLEERLKGTFVDISTDDRNIRYDFTFLRDEESPVDRQLSFKY